MLNCDTPPQPGDVSRAGQYANLLVSISELPSLEVDTVKTTHFWCGKVYDLIRVFFFLFFCRVSAASGDLRMYHVDQVRPSQGPWITRIDPLPTQ